MTTVKNHPRAILNETNGHYSRLGYDSLADALDYARTQYAELYADYQALKKKNVNEVVADAVANALTGRLYEGEEQADRLMTFMEFMSRATAEDAKVIIRLRPDDGYDKWIRLIDLLYNGIDGEFGLGREENSPFDEPKIRSGYSSIPDAIMEEFCTPEFRAYNEVFDHFMTGPGSTGWKSIEELRNGPPSETLGDDELDDITYVVITVVRHGFAVYRMQGRDEPTPTK